MAMIKWEEDHGIDGWTGDFGEQWVLEITPHAKGGWSWCVITDDADHAVPQGWDETLREAFTHSESAYLEWRDGEKEHDETADIVADAVAQERAAVVAWLRAQAYLTLYEATPSDVADAIERGEHRRGEGA
jgi:hypothetical protein